jgi:hypothetical protein
MFPIPKEYSFNKTKTPLDKLTIRSLTQFFAHKSQRTPNAIKNWNKNSKKTNSPTPDPTGNASANYTRTYSYLQSITTSIFKLILHRALYTRTRGGNNSQLCRLCEKNQENLLHLATCPQIKKAFTPILSHLFQIQAYKPKDLLFAFPKADRCLSHLCIIAWKYILQQFCSTQSDQGIIDPETITRNTLHRYRDLLLYWATKNKRAAPKNEAAGRPAQKLSQIN